jgi:UDP-N-acetylmuramoyl-tripeptide--D-alanyl-D-alanine ligase
MPDLDAAFVAQATQGLLTGQASEAPFAGVGTDSRNVAEGQLFVALAGPNFDGHDYVARALTAGAAGALVRQGFSLPAMPEACLIQVADTLTALGDLAHAWRDEHDALVVGLTGSNGKTTTKEMLAAILKQRHRVLATKGNLNNLIGLPLTLMQLNDTHTACVLEMGMNAPGEIARLTEIAAPEVGLVTNVGPAHIGMLGSLTAIARAKAELYAGLAPSATAVVNLDDPLLAPYAKSLACRVLGFGLDAKEARAVRGRDVSAMGGRQAFTLELPGEEPVRVRLAVPGRHNVVNALAAAATACALGLGAETILAGLEEFRQVPGRLTIIARPGRPTLIDDTYNANPASLAAGLEALAVIASGRRRALILGDMYELGDHAPVLHRDCGRAAAASGVALVLALGAQAREVAQGAAEGGLAPDKALAFTEMADLLAAAHELLNEFDVVLVKGSRAMAMERAVKALSGQGETA